MSVIVLPPVVDPVTGNITFVRGEGLKIPLKSVDLSGLLFDVSTADWTFTISGVGEFIPEADPNNPLGRLLVVPPESLDPVPSYGAAFSLIQNDGGPTSLWDGTISPRGGG